MDDALRDLERAARLSADPESRLRHATALARAGRRQAALEVLDLATVPDTHFEELKKLSDALWLEELMAFERAFTVSTRNASHLQADLAGSVMVWTDDLALPAGELPLTKVASLVTGEVLLAEPAFAAFAGSEFVVGIFVEGASSWYRVVTPRGVSEPRPGPHGRPEVTADPTGERVLLRHFADMTADEWPMGIYTWPGLELIRAVAISGQATVDWSSDQLLDNDWDTESCTVVPFDDECEPWPIDVVGFAVQPVGRGLAVDAATEGRGEGLVLHDLKARTRLLVTERGTFNEVSLSSDGRGLRAGSWNGGRRFDVDIARKTVHEREGFQSGRDATPLFRRRSSAWHPAADAWIETRGPVSELRLVDGQFVRDFPRGRPHWVAGGTVLVLLGEKEIEVWRAPRV